MVAGKFPRSRAQLHDWIDYNGVTFLVELLEWDRTFSGFLG